MVEQGVWEQLGAHRWKAFSGHAARDGRRDRMVRPEDLTAHSHGVRPGGLTCFRNDYRWVHTGNKLSSPHMQVCWLPLPESRENCGYCCWRRVPSSTGKSLSDQRCILGRLLHIYFPYKCALLSVIHIQVLQTFSRTKCSLCLYLCINTYALLLLNNQWLDKLLWKIRDRIACIFCWRIWQWGAFLVFLHCRSLVSH